MIKLRIKIKLRLDFCLLGIGIRGKISYSIFSLNCTQKVTEVDTESVSKQILKSSRNTKNLCSKRNTLLSTQTQRIIYNPNNEIQEFQIHQALLRDSQSRSRSPSQGTPSDPLPNPIIASKSDLTFLENFLRPMLYSTQTPPSPNPQNPSIKIEDFAFKESQFGSV